MRAVLQRVREATVSVSGEEVGRIGKGLLVFLGIGQGDEISDVLAMAEKVLNLRVFPDAEDKMNFSVMDISGGILVVSQFTLWGDCRKGRRPSFSAAANPELAKSLYEAFVEVLRGRGLVIQTGRFQEIMEVALLNDGPVTLLLDTRKEF